MARRLTGKHVAVLYEDPRYAHLVEFSYLLKGLGRGLHGIYLTYNEIKDQKKLMIKRGLDVTRYENQNQLHILKISNHTFDFWETIENISDKPEERLPSTVSWLLHSRIVWRFDKKRYSEEQMSSHIEEDSKVHSSLEKSDGPSPNHHFSGSILCSYPIDRMTERHPHWIRYYLNNHHAVILAPRQGTGTVLQSDRPSKATLEEWIRNNLGI